MILQLAILFLPVVIFFIFQRRRKLSDQEQYPPGPKGLPIIGNLHQFNTSAPHIDLWELSQRYGPLMSMKLGSVPVIVVTSPKMAEQVMKTHDLVFCTRPKVVGQNKLSYNGSDIAFGAYSESWRELRKIAVVHLFNSKRVQSFKPVREELVFSLMDRISDLAGSGRAWNVNSSMLTFASTLICRVAFGKIFEGEGSEQHSRFDELMLECQVMQGGFFISDYIPLLGWVDKLSGLMGRLDKVCEELDKFVQGLIDEHLKTSKSKSTDELDILDSMIMLKEQEQSSIDLQWNHIKAILLDIFIAGTDTTAATITWAMTALMTNPNTMKKLQKEIRDLVGAKGSVSEDDLPKLSYLKAVVKETLRLYPPAPLLIPREALDKCTIQGYTINPKTVVYINAWAIARDEEYWENPNEFMPERFLNCSVDVVGRDFQVIPFGAGRRGCPGIQMGLVNVEILLANLVYSFDWELPQGMKIEDIDTEVLQGITMHKKNPLCLVPKICKFGS